MMKNHDLLAIRNQDIRKDYIYNVCFDYLFSQIFVLMFEVQPVECGHLVR